MITAILQICAGLGGIVALWLRDYYSAARAAQRKKEAEHEATQTGRQDLVNGNADAVSARIDRLCSEAGGGDAGSAGGTGGTGPDRTVSRLAGFGIRVE